MELFTLKLLFLFFPGIIALFIVETLTEYQSKTNYYQIVYTFVLGVLSYFTLFLIKSLPLFICQFICGSECSYPKMSIFCFMKDTKLNYMEIGLATIISILLGTFLVYIIQNGLFHKLANKLHISNKFAGSSVWGHILNIKRLDTWVIVRDIKNDLMYEGWINAFSETFEHNELFLSDVKVYKNSTGEELYHIDGLYITRQPNELTIEYPNIQEE